MTTMQLIASALVLVAAFAVTQGVTARQKRAKRLQALRDSFGAPQGDGSALGQVQEFSQAAGWPGVAPELVVDALTWQDLDGDELYRTMDRCASVLGKIQLYRLLHRLQSGPLPAQSPLFAALAQQPEQVFALQRCLQRYSGEHNFTHYTDSQLLWTAPEAFHTRYRTMILAFASLPLWSLLALFVSWRATFLLLLGALLFNFLAAQYLKSKIPTYYAGRSIGTFVRMAKALAGLLAAVEPGTAAELREKADRMAAFSAPLGVMAYSELMAQLGFPDVLDSVCGSLLAYLRLETLVRREHAEICALLETIAKVDVACSLLSFQKSLPYTCAPRTLTELAEAGVTADGLYHPLLTHPVPNDAALARCVLITGSNASGKSTFMKAIGINCILAQTVGFCSARSFALRPGPVASAMNNADSLSAGNSYFINEVRALKRLLELGRQAGGILLIDEIFRGTNTLERVAASSALLHTLYANTAACCITATHDMELTEVLAAEYQLLHFSEQVENGAITFDYRLRPGPSTTKNALLLLGAFGFPPEMIGDAQQKAEAFFENRVWPAYAAPEIP